MIFDIVMSKDMNRLESSSGDFVKSDLDQGDWNLETLGMEEKLNEKEGKMVGVLKKQREELRILKETVKGTILKNIGLEGKLEADHH